MNAAWHERAERGSSLGMRLTLWCYRYLGRRAAASLLPLIAGYFLVAGGSARRASQSYLRRVAAARGEPAPGRLASYRHFLEFGRQLLDRLGFGLMGARDFDIQVEGMAHLDRVAREGRGAVVIGSHLGSFDVLRLLGGLRSPLTVNVLMYTRHAERINRLLEGAAQGGEPAPRIRVLELGGGAFAQALALRARVQRGEVVALLADRVHPGEGERVASVELLGGPAALPTGPWLLASALGCPVLLMTALREGDRRYRVHVEWLADRIEIPRIERVEGAARWCARYAERLEAYCLRAPQQWFNFYPFWVEERSGGRA